MGISSRTSSREPDNALILGPASLVEEVSEIPTERVILSGRTSSFRETVGVLSDYPMVRVVQPATARSVHHDHSSESEPAQEAPEGPDTP